jgi:hypothetical protein
VEPSEAHLRRGWLTFARTGSALIVAFALAVFVASLPVAFMQMRIACTMLLQRVASAKNGMFDISLLLRCQVSNVRTNC